jgi:hypothetical protein
MEVLFARIIAPFRDVTRLASESNGPDVPDFDQDSTPTPLLDMPSQRAIPAAALSPTAGHATFDI